MNDRGILFVLTGPSGVGKGTILSQIRARRTDLYLSISATTRQPRDGEHDGEHYYFVTPEQFKETALQGGFLEHAQFSGNHYGTPAEPVDVQLNAGHDVILEIEVQGAMQVHEKRPDAVRIFIAPPSFSVLRERLTGRGTEDEAVVRSRLDTAKQELALASQFDYIVINESGHVDHAVDEVLAILQAEACRAARRADQIIL